MRYKSNLEEAFKKYYKGDLKKSAFKQVILSFNDECVHQLIYEGKKFSLPIINRLLKVAVRRRSTDINVIDHGASKKLKKEIEAKGLTPYKAIKDKNGNVLKDENGEPLNNGGVKWLVINTNKEFCFLDMGHNRVVRFNDGDRFKFVPVKDKRAKLSKFFKESEENKLLYE